VEIRAKAVGTCDALIALIGTQWLTISDQDGKRRLDDPNDFVRLEIEAALERGVRVIPVLLGNASMPRAEQLPVSLAKLTRRQALELSPNRFESAAGLLLRVLDRTLAEAQAQREAEAVVPRQAETRVKQKVETPGVGRSSKRLWRRITPMEPGGEAEVKAGRETEAENVPSLIANPDGEASSNRPLSRWIAITVAAAVTLGMVVVAVWAHDPLLSYFDHERRSPTSTTAHNAPRATSTSLTSTGFPTNWKRFVSPPERLTFAYPPNWTIHESSPGHDFVMSMTGPGELSIDVTIYRDSSVRDPLQVLRDYAPQVDNVRRSIRLEGGKFAGRQAGFWEFILGPDHRLIVNFFRGSDRFSLQFNAPDGPSWSQFEQVIKYFERSFKVH